MRNSGLTVSRHVLGALGVVTLAFAGIGVFAGTGQAQSPTLTVNPQTGLSDGQSVTVTGTGVDAATFPVVAVVECGNADSNGTPLPGTAPTPADCYGAESVGTGTLLVFPDGSGTATTPYTVHDHGIGANKRRCIDNGNFDCLIAMADVATMGQALLISAPICFGGGCTVGPPPPAIVNPGLAPTTTPTGAEEEAAPPPPGPGAAPPAPAVTARPSLTG
jgi:hypothetical protein